METVIKGVGAVGGAAVKQIPEVQDVLPLPEPESNGSLTNVGIDHSAYKRLPVLPCRSIYT